MTDTERTILQAAANLLRDDAIQRAQSPSSTAEADCIADALLACVAVEKYLRTLADLDRPF